MQMDVQFVVKYVRQMKEILMENVAQPWIAKIGKQHRFGDVLFV